MKLLFAFLSLTAPFVSATPPKPLKTMVIIGDSLTEGFGVNRDQAYPALLQKKLDQGPKKWRVVNSGVSGSTAASAAGRVEWALKTKPDLILIALGANDGLRGTEVKSIEKNLAAAIEKCQAAKVKVILIGIQIPPNYGKKYASQFAGIFPHLAELYKIPLLPFLLKNVGGEKSLNQADGIHPNEQGHTIIAKTVFQFLEKHLWT